MEQGAAAATTPTSANAHKIVWDNTHEKWRFEEENAEGLTTVEVEVPFEKFVNALSGFRYFKHIVKDSLKVFLLATQPPGGDTVEDDKGGDDEEEDSNHYRMVDPEQSAVERKEMEKSADAFAQAIMAHEPAIYRQELAAILMDRAMDLHPAQRRRVRLLLQYLVLEAQVVSPAQLAHCLRRLRSRLPDLEIDCPAAESIYNEFLYDAIVHGLLTANDASELKEPAVSATELREGKAIMLDILKDFYESFDYDTAIERCRGELRPALHGDFIKRIVSVAFDKSLLCHEAASQLIANLCGGNPISTDSAELGFQALLQQAEDLQLDVPDILHRLALFIARAIADEAIPPSFLDRLDLNPSDLSAQITALAAKLLAQDREYHFLTECWEIQSATLAGAQKYAELLTRWDGLRLTPRVPISEAVLSTPAEHPPATPNYSNGITEPKSNHSVGIRMAAVAAASGNNTSAGGSDGKASQQ